jgi:hypothetical protein
MTSVKETRGNFAEGLLEYEATLVMLLKPGPNQTDNEP